MWNGPTASLPLAEFSVFPPCPSLTSQAVEVLSIVKIFLNRLPLPLREIHPSKFRSHDLCFKDPLLVLMSITLPDEAYFLKYPMLGHFVVKKY